MSRLMLVLFAFTLSACSQDTGSDKPGNLCNSTAVDKSYNLMPLDPSIAYRYIDTDNAIETNTEIDCAVEVFNGDKREVLYPTVREIEINNVTKNFSFTVNELVSSSDGAAGQGGTITLHGFEVRNFPVRLLIPESTRLVNFNIEFSKPVTLFNQFFDTGLQQTLDFGEARLVFPDFKQNLPGLTSLMVELAPLLVLPAQLTPVQIGALKGSKDLAAAFIGFVNADDDGLPIQIQGSTSLLGKLDIDIANRTEQGTELETKFRMTLGADLPNNGLAALLKLTIPDITKVKLVANITMAQVLVRKVGPVRRNISFSIDGLDQTFTINEKLRKVTKGDSDGDFAVDVDNNDRAPNDAAVQ